MEKEKAFDYICLYIIFTIFGFLTGTVLGVTSAISMFLS